MPPAAKVAVKAIMTAPPRLFDRRLHRRRLDRAAARFAQADFLKVRAAADLCERLNGVNRHFDIAVDLGARGGVFRRLLGESRSADRVGWLLQTDLSRAMLQGGGPAVVADEERLPLGPGSVDLIVSSLALHWVNDLVGALIQIRMALRPDGLFLGAVLGGATLTELRQCLLEAELEIRGGAGPRVSPFMDAFDAAALLQRAGFALPVADVDTVSVRYDHPLKLMADLRAMGEANGLADRAPLPLNRAVLHRACALYQERFGEAGGRVRATFEIVTLTGWAPHPDQQQPLRPGSAKMRLADALGGSEYSAGDPAG
jgi:SAM-dependent methyltransferase